MLLVNAIAFVAEAANHHPDLEVHWGSVVVRLQTHSAGGVTDKDLQLAERIEATAMWHPAGKFPGPRRPAEWVDYQLKTPRQSIESAAFAVELDGRNPLEGLERYADLPHACLLHSAAAGHPLSRFSFLAADPVSVISAPADAWPSVRARIRATHPTRAAAIPGFAAAAGWLDRLARLRTRHGVRSRQAACLRASAGARYRASDGTTGSSAWDHVERANLADQHRLRCDRQRGFVASQTAGRDGHEAMAWRTDRAGDTNAGHRSRIGPRRLHCGVVSACREYRDRACPRRRHFSGESLTAIQRSVRRRSAGAQS